MGRSIAVVAVAAGVLLAGCGIDSDQVASDARGHSTSTTTTTTTGTTSTTEPGGRSASAEDLLLEPADLGSGWTEGGGNNGLLMPNCADAGGGPKPVDDAQAVLVHGVLGTVLLQTVSVYDSEEQARQAVADFRSGIDACSSALIDVEELSLPSAGDELEAARLKLGASGAGATVDLACVRVGRTTTRLASILLREGGSEQFATAVKKAADKLGS